MESIPPSKDFISPFLPLPHRFPHFHTTTSTKKERLITPARNAGELKLLLKSRQRTMCCKCCTSCQCLPSQSKAISDRLKEERELSNNNNHHVKSELELRWLTPPSPPPQTYNSLILSKLLPPPPLVVYPYLVAYDRLVTIPSCNLTMSRNLSEVREQIQEGAHVQRLQEANLLYKKKMKHQNYN